MPNLTLANLIEQVREEIYSLKLDLNFRDGDSTDTRNSTSPLDSISITTQINKSQAIAAASFRYTMTEGTVTLVANQREYDLPTGCFDVLSVWNSSGYRLRQTTLSGLDHREPKWRSVVPGTPYRYYLVGGRKIGFDVPPSGSGTITLKYLIDPTSLSLLADTLGYIPLVYEPLIVWGAAMICADMDAANEYAQKRKQMIAERYQALGSELRGLMEDKYERDDDASYVPVRTGAQAEKDQSR